MQLKVILTIKNGKDSLVSAGTGSGKTLLIALSMLLDDPEKKLITVTLLPLKCLQMTQESNFNTWYSIPTVIINKDMPREEVWWTVSCVSFEYRFVGKYMEYQEGLSRAC
jgi:Lhr-like helicase